MCGKRMGIEIVVVNVLFVALYFGLVIAGGLR